MPAAPSWKSKSPCLSTAFPRPARDALQKQAGSGKILNVESVTRGSTVSYEAVIQKNGKKSEVAVNADSTPNKD
jgi:hypothetical protein